MNELDELNFMECSVCKSKPGTPQLCESCLNNRAVISRFKEAFGILIEAVSTFRSAVDRLSEIRSVLSYPKKCRCKKPWFENPNCKVHGR